MLSCEEKQIWTLLQHLIDCDAVARRSGRRGLCDAIGRDGLPVQSAALAGHLQVAALLRIEPHPCAQLTVGAG